MYFDEDIAYALGWTVVHSIWQGLAIGMLIATLFWVLKHKSPRLRYYLGMFALLLMTVVSALTFLNLYEAAEWSVESLRQVSPLLDNIGLGQVNEEVSLTTIKQIELFVSGHTNGIVLFWMLGVLFFALKLLGGYLYLIFMRKHSEALNLLRLNTLLLSIQQKLKIKRQIHLANSDFIQSPMVIGCLKPLVLFPVGLVNQLSMKELESILAHELAHIYRLDYLSNILQSIVEVLFYYHPVVWWISASVREEREASCDDIAVSIGGDPLLYAKSLLALQEYAQKPPILALSFTGKKKLLLNRVQRILNHPQNKNNIMEKLSIMFLLFIMLSVMSMSKAEKTAFSESNTPVPVDSYFNVLQGDTIPPSPPTPPSPPSPPKAKKEKMVLEESSRNISINMEDGKITQLIVNGETIAPESYHLYQVDIDKIRNRKQDKRRKGTHRIHRLEKNNKFPGEERVEISVETDTKEGEDGARKVVVVTSDEGNVLTDDGNIIYNVYGDHEDGQPVKVEIIDSDGKVNQKYVVISGDFDDIDKDELHRSLDEAMVKTEISRQKIDELLKEYDVVVNGEMQDAQDALELAELEKGRANDRLFLIEGAVSAHAKQAWLAFLMDEGRIKDPENFRIKFTQKALKINGKRQSKKVLKKCLELYEQQNGFPLSKDSKIAIKRSN